MNRFFLSTYTIRIENKPILPDSRYLNISDFDDKKSDLLPIMIDFLEHLKTNPVKDDLQKILLSVSRLEVYNGKRIITGIIDNGLYGLAGKIVDTDTNSTSYEKKTTDADVYPFFFLLSIPQNRNEAILILGRVGDKGIRKYFYKAFSSSFSKQFNNYKVTINTLLPDKVVQQFLEKGTIKKLRFIKYDIPTDRFDGLDDGHKEIPINAELVLSAKEIKIQTRINSFFNKKNSGTTVKNLFELEEQNFEYDTIKLEVSLGSQRKIIDLSSFSKIRNYIDVTQDISKDSNGFPDFDSIEKEAKIICEDLSSLLYSVHQ